MNPKLAEIEGREKTQGVDRKKQLQEYRFKPTI